MIITPVATSTSEGKELIKRLEDRYQSADDKRRRMVSTIIAEVRARGDEALLEYTNKFDAPHLDLEHLRVNAAEIEAADSEVPPDLKTTINKAIKRVRDFHEHEKQESWLVTRDDGAITGRLIHPVDSAGLYVPGGQGGKTPLVSSVLMNGIPAVIAGVKRLVMLTPPSAEGGINPALTYAASQIGIKEIYKAGSAWGIAALAYGTASIAPVDVVVGPGNQFVTEAKKQVAGRVRIDMIAGPSEVLIVADKSANPTYIAADMLAQAEHDPLALAVLITTSPELSRQVNEELTALLPRLSREDIARQSLNSRGTILLAADLEEALELSNILAAEHLELMIEEPFQWLPRIRHAGAIFLGPNAPEAVGDYLAGPNHVLPTMGTARYSSSLGVETFLKKSSLISYSRQALLNDGADIMALANLEGLSAHALSVDVRLKNG